MSYVKIRLWHIDNVECDYLQLIVYAHCEKPRAKNVQIKIKTRWHHHNHPDDGHVVRKQISCLQYRLDIPRSRLPILSTRRVIPSLHLTHDVPSLTGRDGNCVSNKRRASLFHSACAYFSTTFKRVLARSFWFGTVKYIWILIKIVCTLHDKEKLL